MTGPSSYPLHEGGMPVFQRHRKRGRPRFSEDSYPRNQDTARGPEPAMSIRDSVRELEERFPHLRGVERDRR